jgi:hypothetical protein
MEKKKVLNIVFCFNMKIIKPEDSKEKQEKYLEFDNPEVIEAI